MSQQVVEEIKQFLKSPVNGVIVISGKWGTGKTFEWRRSVKELSKSKKINPKYYAYVSLFGLRDVAELKAAIFTARVKSSKAHRGDSSYRRFLRFLPPALSMIPKVGTLSSELANAYTFSMIKNAVVCFDDLERSDLDPKHALGVASELIEQRNCRVAFILNESQVDEGKSAKYRKHLEKLSPFEIAFERSPESASSIVFESTTPYFELAKRNSISLGIKNLRVLSTISRRLRRVSMLLKSRKKSTVEHFVNTLVLTSYCKANVDNTVPTLEYLNSGYHSHIASSLFNKDDSEEGKERREWGRQLYEYGYQATDELDRAIIDYVDSGILRADLLKEALDKRDQTAMTDEAVREIREVWNVYYGTFSTDKKSFADQLVNVYSKHIGTLTPVELNNAVSMLRSLGYKADADTLIDSYVEANQTTPEKLDLDTYIFRDEITDSTLSNRLQRALALLPDDRTIPSVMDKILRGSSYSPKDTQFLAAQSKDDYRTYFLGESDLVHEAISWMIKAPVNADAHRQKISEDAIAVLKQLASESEMNQFRIEGRYGIKPDPHPPDQK